MKAIELIRQAEVKAKKNLGQHFLVNDGIIQKIIGPVPEKSHCIEIGPGPGVLTQHLLQKSSSFIVIEKDETLKEHLEKISAEHPQCQIYFEDFLKFSFERISKQEKYWIVSNLPYNISTAILIKILKDFPYEADCIFMFQKEVADRIIAKVNQKNYGSLSVLSQSLATIKKVCDVSPGSFLPAPEVESTVLHFELFDLKTRQNLLIENLEILLRKAFGQRRKMLRSSLKNMGFHKDTRRPQELTVEEWNFSSKEMSKKDK